MKTIKYYFTLVLLCAAAVAAHAQSTAITYQGRLAANGFPYTGLAEMQCLLFSSPTGGVPIATNQPAVASVNVNNGLFTVPLDFGAGAFPGTQRFLEIQVRTNLGAFFTLTPRQALTPAPSALFALTAGGPWVTSGSDLSYTAGKVGVGTTSPAKPLHVRADEPVLVLEDSGSESTQSGYVAFWNNASETGWVGFGTPGSQHFSVVNARTNGNIVLSPGAGGAVMLGPSGESMPTSGGENVRIIRGTINGGDGSRAGTGGGAGFTSMRISEGDYLITFDTPFTSVPSVTATTEDRTDSLMFEDFLVASVFSPSANSVRIRTRAHSDSGSVQTGPADNKFHFIAIGLR